MTATDAVLGLLVVLAVYWLWTIHDERNARARRDTMLDEQEALIGKQNDLVSELTGYIKAARAAGAAVADDQALARRLYPHLQAIALDDVRRNGPTRV